jgi:hypothetical protein
MNVLRALSSGFGAPQILGILASAYPALAQRIKDAQKLGHSIDDILKQFQGLSPKELKKLDQKAAQSSNPLIQGMEATRQTSGEAFKEKQLIPAGLALGASFVAPAIAQGAQKLLGGLAGAIPSATPPSPGPHPMANAPVQPPPIQQPQAPVGAAAAAQQGVPVNVSPTPAPTPLSPAKQKAQSFLEALGVNEQVKELARQGKTPQEIAAEIQTGLHPAKRKAYQEKRMRGEELPIETHVKEYLTTPEGLLREDVVKFGMPNAQTAQVAPQERQGLEPPGQKLDETKEAAKRPAKGSLVVTPDGNLGTIKDIKQKEALVESDGKLHKVKVSDTTDVPVSEKELADYFDEMIHAVERETGEQVSRNVDWSGYDPNTNTLAYLPHGGGLYTYEDISPEDVKFLTNILNVRKTSGENFIGAWTAGSKSPIGAAMSALIQRLQKERGGKGNEYSHKFQKVYHSIEAAQQASKARKKKK